LENLLPSEILDQNHTFIINDHPKANAVARIALHVWKIIKNQFFFNELYIFETYTSPDDEKVLIASLAPIPLILIRITIRVNKNRKKTRFLS
jgi:hypothetical protein